MPTCRCLSPCWLTPALPIPSVKFILLHEGRNDDGIRNFFLDVFEAWTKVRRRCLAASSKPSACEKAERVG